jgi:ATP-dependent DNA helicase PIF1
MKVEINKKFKEALKLMEKSSENVFITGKAGTGKSTLLKYFRETTKKSIVVLAPTGVSAVNIGGQTVHSFFGFKPDITLEKVRTLRGDKRKVLEKLTALVIDEISMVRADMMDYIDKSLQINRGRDEPFGGVQMIFFGDLFQLPPIVRGDEKEIFKMRYESPYFFSSQVFQSCDFKIVELEKIYRQKNQEFIDVLGKIRNGSTTQKDLDMLNTRFDPDFKEPEGSLFINLTTVNKKADEINADRLDSIEGHLWKYESVIEGDFKKSSFPTEEVINLRIGSQLMLLNNDSDGRWVNGTVGILDSIKSDDENDTLIVRLSDGNLVDVEPNTWDIFKFGYNKTTKKIISTSAGSFTQYPVKLAWAITIHKAQGKTFEKVILDLGRGAFAPGQTYVALSRCVSLEGLVLRTQIKKSHIFTDWKVSNFLTNYYQGTLGQQMSLEEKSQFINDCIVKDQKIELDYLKGGDERSKRLIKPEVIGRMKYRDKTYLGVKGFCYLRNAERAFRLDRILSMKIKE